MKKSTHSTPRTEARDMLRVDTERKSNVSISVVIYTYNEEKNITDCISSAKLLTDNILVVDMQSNDNAIKIAEENGAEVFDFPYTKYVEPAREFGINKAEADWVFILDADERITKELAEEIKKILTSDNYSHYKVLRRNVFGRKKWLKYGGWWPDFQIRLINKEYFKAWPKEIHSTPKIEGNQGMLKNPLVHYFHGDFEQMVDKTIIFEDIESDLFFKAEKKASTLTFFRKFLGELSRRLLKNLGFLDGKIGIIESIYQAFSKTITYLYLYEKSRII